MGSDRLESIQAELREQLNGADASEVPVEGPFTLREFPRIEQGVVIQSDTVAKDGRLVEYAPVSSVVTVRETRRGVGVFLRNGHFLLLWVGDDLDQRAVALSKFLSALAENRPRFR